MLVAMLLFAMGGKSQPAARDTFTVLPDSSNFVTASLLVSEPLTALYSVFGHATLRMECPSFGLDFVFTFESETDVGTFMTGVAGKAKARYVAVPTERYIADAQQMGRELMQYKLNLTHHEKQALWKMLDEEMMAGAYRNFNLLYTNCLTTSILCVQRCLIGEHFEWGSKRYPMTQCDGGFLRYSVRHSPWAEFLFITYIGTAYNDYSIQESKLSPETIVPMLREARIVSDDTGETRFVVTDPGVMLVKGGNQKPTPVTPTMVFGLLLAVTLLVTWAEWKKGCRRMAKIYDTLLFAAQTLTGLSMLYVTLFSELFASAWNWYFISFFPLPLLFWLLARKPKVAACCWLAYSIMLALFILATPFIGSLDVPHQLITGSLLVRSLSYFFGYKHKNNLYEHESII